MLHTHLALAERHLADAELRIVWQEQVILSLNRARMSTEQAEQFLRLMLDVQHQMLRHRNLIAAQLAQHGRLRSQPPPGFGGS